MPVETAGFTADALGGSIGEQVRAFTIATAEQALRDEVSRGFDSQPVVVTDGTPRRDYNQVKPFGKIEFVANPLMAEIVRWALTELQKRSPVLSGFYASSHTVMINGVQVEGDIWAALRKVAPTDRVQIVNTAVYARKIEGATASRKTGRGRRRASSKQARAGVYRPVLRELVQRWGKAMFFDFKYVKLNTGVKVWGDQGGNYYDRKKKGGGGTVRHRVKRVQRDQVYPAIQFFIGGSGR